MIYNFPTNHKNPLTREQWLLAMSKQLESLFNASGYAITAKYRVSCSLPSKGAFASKLRRIGEAWHSTASADGTCEIFISPTIADSKLVASTLAHELVHVCVGNENGHNKMFKRCAEAIGLTGKMTATVASDRMAIWLEGVIKDIGEFPHAELDKSQRKKQSTRMLKVVCPYDGCDFYEAEEKRFTVRMSKTVFDFAAPICGVCRERMEIETK